MAFHWRADDDPFVAVFGSSISSSTKKTFTQIWSPSDTNFLDPRMHFLPQMSANQETTLRITTQSEYMRGSRKFCQCGLTMTTFTLVDEGREDPNITKRGPSSACQRTAIEMAFHWRADDGCFGSFEIFQGIRTSIAKKPYIFVIFQEGGPDPLPPTPAGSTHDIHTELTLQLPLQN